MNWYATASEAATDLDGDDAGVELLRHVVDRAVTVAALHVSHDGICGACLDLWARLAPAPCVQARWAATVLARARTIHTIGGLRDPDPAGISAYSG